MTNHDLNYKIDQLSQKFNEFDEKVDVALDLLKSDDSKKELWTDADFIKNLGVSERTPKYWREKGWIEYKKIGGRIYYTTQQREAFFNRQ